MDMVTCDGPKGGKQVTGYLEDYVCLLNSSVGGKVFQCLRPFTVKDFETIKLADCVRHIEDLQTLYPNQDKAEAFREFYTSAGNVDGFK